MQHQRLRERLSAVVKCLSLEFVLTEWRWANGGDVILMRTLAISLEIYITAIALKNLVDPTRLWTTSFEAIGTELVETGTYMGPIFAAVYAALYTRFSSQWGYLAGVYNSIKETEAGGVDDDGKQALAQWKAGFIDDADTLHLASKGSFAGVVLNWARDEEVGAAYVAANQSTGAADLRALVERIELQHKRGASPNRQSPYQTTPESAPQHQAEPYAGSPRAPHRTKGSDGSA